MKFDLFEIGLIRNDSYCVQIEVYPKYRYAMLGITEFSHIIVSYWLHENDTVEDRGILKVHPEGNPNNPIVGVFSTRSPKRPNPLAITICKIVSVWNNFISIEDIDARNNSPLIDIKGYFPEDFSNSKILVPNWSKSKCKR